MHVSVSKTKVFFATGTACNSRVAIEGFEEVERFSGLVHEEDEDYIVSDLLDSQDHLAKLGGISTANEDQVLDLPPGSTSLLLPKDAFGNLYLRG
ncbi:hypothetical protein K2173_013706 [Erythroxylum novogranatense]|uniref:Uncharacterized protein n=1 Tax=Erythroxylum novogranatense TaxID=1862640 RepID=A0AAV8SAM8_9ROSI|nr:hypothetical protein K2173_013706 [Erythroxylum novogranatense]